MGKLSEAYVDITGRRDKLDRTMGSVRADLGSFASRATSMLRVPVTLVTAGATAGLAAYLGHAAKAAADFGETMSKVKTVFGASAGIITDQADDLANKFGLVKSTSLDAAANIGLIGQASGLTKGASAQLSNTMVKLAADASSFFNVPMDVALEKIRAGLVGEAEPMRAFGVMLSESQVKLEAMRLGLIKGKQEMTEQQKVMARASLITKGMATVSGDLERTQDSTANQMKKLTGQIENFTVVLGTKLVPALDSAVKAAMELGTSFEGAFKEGPVDAFAGSVKGVLDLIREINLGEGGVGGNFHKHLVRSLLEKPGFNMLPSAKRVHDQLSAELQQAGTDMHVPNAANPVIANKPKPLDLAMMMAGAKDQAVGIGSVLLRAFATPRLQQAGAMLGMAQGVLGNFVDVRQPDAFTSQRFGSVRESANAAQSEYLSRTVDIGKQQVNELVIANRTLKDAADFLRQLVAKPGGAILRGE
jgi:hypothetical protein